MGPFIAVSSSNARPHAYILGHGVSLVACSHVVLPCIVRSLVLKLPRELLEPWVHYVPLNQNATDVGEKMQWVIDNDDDARRIAERASLWMEDLCFHPDAALDDRLVQEEMMRRYRAHFRQSKETE